MFFNARRVEEDRNSRRDTASHEVRRFECTRTTGIRRCDDDVRGCERFVHDERPSCGSQSRFLNAGNTNEDSRSQCAYHEDRGQPQPPVASGCWTISAAGPMAVKCVKYSLEAGGNRLTGG
jgi:hypothetical protein